MQTQSRSMDRGPMALQFSPDIHTLYQLGLTTLYRSAIDCCWSPTTGVDYTMLDGRSIESCPNEVNPCPVNHHTTGDLRGNRTTNIHKNILGRRDRNRRNDSYEIKTQTNH